jgi:hypothetical protein
MPLTDDQIQGALFFELRDHEGNPVGLSAVIRGETKPQLVAAFAGISTDFQTLLAAAPILYQNISGNYRVAQSLIDEFDKLVTSGQANGPVVQPLITALQAMQTAGLSAQLIAREGVEAFVKANKAPPIVGKDPKR